MACTVRTGCHPTLYLYQVLGLHAGLTIPYSFPDSMPFSARLPPSPPQSGVPLSSYWKLKFRIATSCPLDAVSCVKARPFPFPGHAFKFTRPRLRPGYLTLFIPGLDHGSLPRLFLMYPLDHPGLAISEHADKVFGPFMRFFFTLLDTPVVFYFLSRGVPCPGATSVPPME